MGTTPYYDKNGITIYLGPCEDVMPQLEPGFGLCLTDPPYYDIVDEGWDKQWESLSDYVDWLELAILEIKRLLLSKGSLYVFADDKHCAYVQVMIDRHLNLLNNIVWFKTNALPQKAAHKLRSYAPMTERILFYTPQLCRTGLETVKLDLNNFVPLREYFRDYQEALGLGLKEINKQLGHRRAEHSFYWNSTQWEMPTEETYNQLSELPIKNEFLRRDYEDLRRDYEFSRRDYKDLRRDYEDLRRTFNATKSTFDVIEGPIVSTTDNTDHPTTKPEWLIKHLIVTSTKAGDKIIDPFMGSGTTLKAVQDLGYLEAVGIEQNEEYIKIAIDRLRQPTFFSIPEKPNEKPQPSQARF